MADVKPLTCSVMDFAHVTGIGEEKARAICAGLYPPPLVMVGNKALVIRARIPEWLDQEAARQLKEKRLDAGVLGDVATEPGNQALQAL